MSFLRTLILALLVAGFGAYIYLVEQPRMAEESAGDPVMRFEVSEVRAITLRYPDERVLRVERDDKDSQWRMTQPLETRADQDQVNRLLKAIHDAKVDRRVPGEQAKELKTYGLEGGGTQARIELEIAGGETLPAIIVGDATPVGYQAFVRVDGQGDLLVTPLLFHSGVAKTTFDLRDKRLFDVELADAVRTTVKRGGSELIIEREGSRWKITAPYERRADTTEAEGLVHALNQIQAMAFVDPGDSDDKGLDAPWLDVEVDLGKAGTVGFVAGKEDNEKGAGYFIRRKSDGQVAKVPAWIKTRYDRDASAFRDRALFDCVRGQVSRVSVQRADSEPFSLVRSEDSKWQVEPNPDQVRVRQGEAARAVDNLAAFKPQTLVADEVSDAELARYGLASPAIELEVSGADGKLCGAAAVGVVAGDDGKPAYYFRRSDDRTVWTAPQYLFSRVDLRRTDLVTAPPKDTGAGDTGAKDDKAD